MRRKLRVRVRVRGWLGLASGGERWGVFFFCCNHFCHFREHRNKLTLAKLTYIHSYVFCYVLVTFFSCSRKTGLAFMVVVNITAVNCFYFLFSLFFFLSFSFFFFFFCWLRCVRSHVCSLTTCVTYIQSFFSLLFYLTTRSQSISSLELKTSRLFYLGANFCTFIFLNLGALGPLPPPLPRPLPVQRSKLGNRCLHSVV